MLLSVPSLFFFQGYLCIVHFCSNEYQIVMAVLWKRINDTGKNWRHVYKVLCIIIVLFIAVLVCFNVFPLVITINIILYSKGIFWGCYCVFGINHVMFFVIEISSSYKVKRIVMSNLLFCSDS